MPRHKAFLSNITVLSELADLLTPMTDNIYQKQSLTYPKNTVSSIGAHCRHIIEFYQGFFTGVASGTINYDDRARNPELEENRTLAINEIQSIQQQLRELTRKQAPSEQVHLQAQVDFETPVVAETNLVRELVFLQAHSVHHQAMIALLMLCFEQSVPKTFGFATSTRINQKQELETQAAD